MSPAENDSGALGYQPAFDGLRAVAIGAVVVYHWSAQHAGIRGGFLGVELFFLLSGFLITRLLVEEHRSRDRIALGGFYRRRIARLYPAYITLIVVALALTVVYPSAADVSEVRTGAVASMTYTTNWYVVANGLTLGPLNPLWSLAVEEQFYLLWPLVLLLLLGRVRTRAVGWVAVGAAAIVFVQVAIRSFGGSGALEDLYVGTDAQAAGFLLAGCATALLVPIGDGLTTSRWAAPLARYGWLAALPVMAFVATTDHTAVIYYRGVYAILAVLMVVIVLSALVDSPVRRAMSVGPLVWIGKRSYAIYLWHTLIAAVVITFAEQHGYHLGAFKGTVMCAIVAVAIADMSYRFVEMPMRRRISGRSSGTIQAETREVSTDDGRPGSSEVPTSNPASRR